ncbi:MAG: tetratricopeptide repeat protein [Dysgonamonadaceae bacterium]|jgi:TolA-binding protein|nr:tetratricopeptide repeat protein [Dysgonamonadaceae bacterium]
MKKITLFVSLALVAQLSVAQRSVYHQLPERLFNQGKEQYLSGNYTGAEDLLGKYLSQPAKNALLAEEAKYMIAGTAFYRGAENSGDVLQEFLAAHPETIHRNQLNFFVGSCYFDQKDWAEAGKWFRQADLDYLSPSEQEDYSFRRAYTDLQLGNKDNAYRLFGLLHRNSDKYRASATYYLGYIDYSNGSYDAALKHFDKLRNNPEYREEAAFYSAQATFFKGNLDQAIQLGETFADTHPRSEHLSEIYRVLGNANYRQGRISKAIPYYERYIATTDKPLRGDAYFLGLSYTETGKHNDAVRMFQQAVGESDPLSQNAQLQLGQVYLKLGDKQKAQMAFEAASRDNFDPKVRETAMFNYALLAHQTNFSVFSESITLFENFLKQYPNSQYTDQVNDILAETFLTTKDYNAALAAINRIAKPGKRILEAKQMILFQLGAQQFINGDMNEAIQFFNNSTAMGNYDTQARNNAYFWRGEANYRLRNFNAAATDFQFFTQNAASSDENYAAGWYDLGYTRFKQNQYASARDAFLKYVSFEKNKDKAEYADTYNRIGDTYYYTRNFNEAERYYANAASANPSAADYADYQKAFVIGLQRNYQGKINALDDLMRKYPQSQYYDDALYEKSRALAMLSRENEAIPVLQKLISDYPQSQLASQAGIQLGQMYYNSENYQQAVAAYKNVVKNFPGSDDARSALISLETVYRDMNDIQSYVSYANSLPGGMRITASRQDSLTYLAAEGVYMRGSKTEAETALQRYLQSFPNGVYGSDANYYLGVLADGKGDKTQALAHFRKVIDAGNAKFLDPALLYASQCEYENKDYRQALADYSRLANTAQNAESKQAGQLGVARSQYALQGYNEAAQAASALLDNKNLSPEIVAEAHSLRGKSYQQVSETEKAVQDFQSIAKDTRTVYGAEAQFILADTYYRWKSYDKAEAQVKEFMQKGTSHQYWLARALIVLSDTYKAKGDDFQAKQYLESLKANYKGNEADITEMINERLK